MPFFGWLVLSDEQMEQFRRVHPSLLNDEQMSVQRAGGLRALVISFGNPRWKKRVGIQGSQKKIARPYEQGL